MQHKRSQGTALLSTWSMRRRSKSPHSRRGGRSASPPSILQETSQKRDAVVLYQRNEAGGGVVTKVVCEGFEHRTVTRAHHTRQRLGPNRFEAFVVYIVSCVRTILVETFLPKGYPESVAPEYLRFQTWDSIQAMCSYLRGVLSSKALFEAVGVGNQGATALAATVTWILRDGASMLGNLVFAWWGGSRFDEDVKFWRLFADVINDVGLTLEMMAPLCGSHFQLVACLAKICTGLCGVSAGATRATIVNHFARHNNLADVAAKESSQETAVTLAGLLCGLYIATFLEVTPAQSWVAFVSLTILHVVANWRAVTCLTFNTLNCNRAALAVDAYIADMVVKDVGELYSKQDLRPDNIARVEPLLPSSWWRRGTSVFFPSSSVLALLRLLPIPAAEVPVTLQFGCDARTLFRCAESSAALSDAFNLYDPEEYVATAGTVTSGFGLTKRVVVAVAFKSKASPEDKLKAYFQACAFRIALQSLWGQLPRRRFGAVPFSSRQLQDVLRDSYLFTQKLFPGFLQALIADGWVIPLTKLGGGGFIVTRG